MQAKELFEIGEACERLGKLDMARRSFARIIALHPNEIIAYHKLAILAFEEGDYRQALAFIEKGLAIDRNAVGLWNNRGLILKALGRATESRESFETALSIQPSNFYSNYNLGLDYIECDRLEEAEHSFRRACERDPASVEALVNLGEVLCNLLRYDEAAEAYRHALAVEPSSVELLIAYGEACRRAHLFDDARTALFRAIQVAPEHPIAHYTLALVHLGTGNLYDGFREYEWRFERSDWKPRRPFSRKPQWIGEPLQGATLLVHAEQGLGDSLQFLRFIRELSKLDCEIIVDVQPELYRLFSSTMEYANVRWSSSEKLLGSDVQIPLLSLPRALGVTYESLPPFKPYLRPRPRDMQVWRGKLNRMTGMAWGSEVKRRKQKRIGIVWAGSTDNPDDGNRSMTFETMSPLIETHKDHAIFFSLQRGQSANHPAVIDLGNELTDFTITAAIVANLDLIISVDTSMVHLAGAMGQRVWTLLSHTPDWRWTIGQNDTKWYPTMSLFWQPTPGDWQSVITEVIATLD